MVNARNQVVMVSGDQKESRQCYFEALRVEDIVVDSESFDTPAPVAADGPSEALAPTEEEAELLDGDDDLLDADDDGGQGEDIAELDVSGMGFDLEQEEGDEEGDEFDEEGEASSEDGASEEGSKKAEPKKAEPKKAAAKKAAAKKAEQKEAAAKKKARAKANKAANKAAKAWGKGQLAILDGTVDGQQKSGKKGKGKGKGDRPPLPKGIKTKSINNKPTCSANAQGLPCLKDPCPFEHCCWWCGGAGCAKCKK